MKMNSEIIEIYNTPKRKLTKFFGLLLLISFPGWILTALTKQFIPEGLPINHIGFLMVFFPLIVAFILTYRDYGKVTAKELLKRSFDFKRIEEKVWFLPILFLLPIIYVISLGIMIFLGITSLKNTIPVGTIPLLFIMMLIFAIGEEIGWQGYVFGDIDARWNSLYAAILLGLIWGIWHVPLFIIQDPPGGFLWITGQCLYMVVLRVLIVWIYKNTNKSVFTAIIIHAISNLCGMVFPIYNSPLGPFIASILIVITLVIVLQLKGIEGLYTIE
ncbi:MAG: CPBP family intramembrane glutamic endopeptidase [Candidatus Thorarchaeota archaeon]